jgi:TPR repeat protein
VERKDRWYVFDTITNEDGSIFNVFAYEDHDRFGADEIGLADAQYEMGIRYLNGDRVPKSAYLAKEYLQKAAAQGNQMAIGQLRNLPP